MICGDKPNLNLLPHNHIIKATVLCLYKYNIWEGGIPNLFIPICTLPAPNGGFPTPLGAETTDFAPNGRNLTPLGARHIPDDLSTGPRFCLQHRAHPFFVFAGDGKAGVGNGDGIGGYEGSVSCIDQI